MPIVADAAVKVGADMAAFNADLKRGGEQGTRTLGQQLRSAFSPQNLAVAGVAGGLALAGAITAGLVGAAKSLMEIERLNAQTDAAIRSTGGVANVTREGVEELAEGLESLTTAEREVVQEGANLLLTFTNVRNLAGEGNDIFDRATGTALDLSVALGTDMRSASMMLGKALNDPIAGVTALTRAGVQLTDQQKEQIAAFVEAGDVLSAQRVILRELETQVGGSAEAFAGTTAGKIQRFQNDVGNMFESIIVGAVEVADFFGSTAESIGNGVAGIGDAFGAVGDFIGSAFDDPVEEARQRLATLPPATYAAAFEGQEEWARGVDEGGPVVAAAWDRARAEQQNVLDRIVEDARTVGRDSVLALATAILERQQDPLLAIDALNAVMEQSMSDLELIGQLTGEDTMESLRTALGSTLEADRIAAREALQPIMDTLNSLGPAGRAAGLALMTQLGIGMRSAAPVGVRYARDAAGMITAVFPQSEPKDPLSPWRGITHWGADILDTIFGNLDGRAAAASVRRALGGISAGLGGAMPMGVVAAGGAGGGAGGVTYQLVVNGVPRAFNSRDDFMNALDDLGSFGDGRLS